MRARKGDISDTHLIDDSGLHKSNKKVQITVFVALCRIVTVLLIALGVAALIVGNM